MYAETETFLQALFERCDRLVEGAFVTLTAIHPRGDLPTPSHHLPLGKPDLLLKHLTCLQQANEQGWGAYIGIATRRSGLGRWSRSGKADLFELPALFVDMDDPGPALWNVTFFPIPPSILVSSGRGYHAYWLLDTPTSDFHQTDLILKGLAECLGGDPVLTVANSMRLPGTINNKSGRENALCHIVEYAPEQHYRLAEFSSLIPAQPAFSSWHKPSSNRVFLDNETFKPVIDAVTAAVLQILDGHPRRSLQPGAHSPIIAISRVCTLATIRAAALDSVSGSMANSLCRRCAACWALYNETKPLSPIGDRFRFRLKKAPVAEGADGHIEQL